MIYKDKWVIGCIFILILNLSLTFSSSILDQFLERDGTPREDILKWCTLGIEEYKKCNSFSHTIKRDVTYFEKDYMTLECVNGSSKEDCMHLIEEERADITTVDAGEVFVGGRYFSLIPILQHIYSGNLKYYYAVAVVKKNTLGEVTNIRQLRGKKACFTGVGRLAGWTIPIYTLMKKGGLDIVDCNNQVKNAINFFGPSCAVNSLKDKHNPVGDNSDKLCQLCIGEIPGGKCTNADPYAGFTGAFRCLIEAGEIAFVKHTTISELTSIKAEYPTVSKDNFELLCTDGSRKPVDDYLNCNWGKVPSPGIITSSAKSSKTRRRYQKFLQKSIQFYSPVDNVNNTKFGFNKDPYDRDNYGRDQFGREQNRDQYNRNEYDSDKWNQDGSKRDPFNREQNNRNPFERLNSTTLRPYDEYTSTEQTTKYETFNFFESVPRYGKIHNLLVEDTADHLMAIEENKQTYSSYLGTSIELIMTLRDCPVRIMTLCVTSDPEMEKCLKMRTALKAQILKPEMSCFKGHSHIHCMQAINNGDADVAVLDAGDVYTAGLNHNLLPFMSEVYNLGSPEYYVIAVAKEEDPSTEITYLKGKNTCHGGINTAAGWIIPMAFMLSNGWIRPYGCNAMRAAAEYFSKSCVPGAISNEYNIGLPYDNMCHLCHGSTFTYCRRDASEVYFGHTGAFRCLVEGGGDVAFVKHTTVLENTDGKRREFWARNALNEDFELLCPDGTRATLNKYKDCNLGKVKANAIVTRGGDAYNLTEINAYINLFIYAQQFYGRKDQDDFNFAMFYSRPPFADLIFQDASTQLKVVPPELRWYSDYLGKDFMRAKRVVDCHAGANNLLPPFYFLIAISLIYFILSH